MNDKHVFEEKSGPYPYYEIRLQGHLDQRWAEWFEDLTITLEANGETLLAGFVADQAALHGLLKKVRDLGIPLISVSPVAPSGTESQPQFDSSPNQRNESITFKKGNQK